MRNLLGGITTDHRVRFLIIGAINTGVGYVVFVAAELLIFGGLQFGYMASLGVSYSAGITVAYLLYRRFVFRDVEPWWRSLPRFVSVYLVSIALNAALLPLLVAGLGLGPVIAQALCLIITTALSYVGHRWFSFRGGPISRRTAQ